jgi:N-acetylmuramoyl-L-alanine amidase
LVANVTSVTLRKPALACVAAFLWASAALPASSQQAPARLSALATEPDWTRLEAFQGTMSRVGFVQLLDTVYAPNGAWKNTITIADDGAHILTTGTNRWVLHFAGEIGDSPANFPALYWKPIPAIPSGSRPLDGIKIALDPGHLGGKWAHMEERWFQMGAGTVPVAEGDMTLLTARLLAVKLRAAGAEVVFAHNSPEPLTPLRPEDLRDVARAQLQRQGMKFIRDGYDGAADELRMNSIRWTSELLFYRTAEIQARARLVNDELKPDIVLCMHYNAESWGDPAKPEFVPHNHMHLLVNGCYSAQELALDDVRYAMLLKLLSRTYDEELPVANHVANALAAATGLPPYHYTTPNAIRVGDNPYVWARDLLANRLYECPVVYIEPYVMNSQEVWDRVQAGNYEGRKMIDGKMRESIYQEYANAVEVGLEAAARDLRSKPAQ